VRLIFIDEAGLSNPEQEPFLVVGAVIVHADQKLIAVQRHLDRLVRHHIPREYQDDFVFHATHIFNGGGKVFKRAEKDDPNPEWPLERRLKIATDLAAIPAKFQLPVTFGFVNRAEWPRAFTLPDGFKQRDKEAWCHASGFLVCAIQVDLWMRSNANDEICLLVVEDNDNSRRVLREAQRHHQGKNLPGLPKEARRIFPLRKIKQDPLFEPKRKSSVLQVADFCTYVFKRILMNPSDERYAPFYDAFRRQVILSSW
jgi:uncharacterized protein DUF3800